ncbi:dimethylaniline monooxygenase [N-oxide-forming] 5-like [Asterias rubens]|uniref:dimethylaniline monooxygenase [N-oxide-forming] 5-like n=1 Tax=Asterias rubens TaxID=7604 RepID=UPI00145502FB|nr:dimethylaniline monooxygenase [N-oxide-forming] 5-like [Asterias rubens]
MSESCKTVAIIGAGVTGLTAIKCSLDEGLQPTCFERFDSIGGLWTYRDTDAEYQTASVYKTTVTNTSKETNAFSDFPFPKEWPNYMHHSYMNKYLNMYADEFGLEKCIRLSTSVTRLEQAPDYDISGRWVVTTKHKNEMETSQEFDAVMICTGMFNNPFTPDVPGMDEFQGKISHTNGYRTATEFEGKRGVVVGIGNSAGDAATETSRVASQVFLSARHGMWLSSRRGPKGYPIELAVVRRRFLRPLSMVMRSFEKSLEERYEMVQKPLKPAFGVLASELLLNEDIPGCILNGSVVIKGDLARFTKTGVEFVDGSREDNIDFVIFATGYRFDFPFKTDCPALQVLDQHVPLYKLVFPLGLKHSTLSVNGHIKPVGAVGPCSELQARWAARIFKGLAKLPSQSELAAEVKMADEEMAASFANHHRHVHPLLYMDNIATEIGARPNFLKMFFTDPEMSLRCVFGPAIPFHYRLVGPGKWAGAREAIATVWDRVLEPVKTRKPTDQTTKSGSQMLFVCLGIAVLVAVVGVLMVCN